MVSASVGGYFEWHSGGALSASTKYYSADGTRVAMRQTGVVTYLFGDHLPPTLRSGGAARGSTSVAYNDAADTTCRQGYTAFGTERYNLGEALPTRYQFAGQRGFEIAFFDLFLPVDRYAGSIAPCSLNLCPLDSRAGGTAAEEHPFG